MAEYCIVSYLGAEQLRAESIPKPHRSRQPASARCCIVLATFALLAGAQPLRGADPQSLSLNTDEIVSRLVVLNAKRETEAQPYTATRHYTVEYKGFPSDRHAEMMVKVVSTPPQKQLTIVSESGSRLLINRVLRRLIESEREAGDPSNSQDTKLIPDNYDFQLIGKERVDEHECYVLQVTPKKKNKFLYVGRVWVDAQDFAVVRISAKPAKNPSFWISSVEIEHRYAKHGEMWLPQSNRSTSKVRLGGWAVLTIDYQEYEFQPASLSTRWKHSSLAAARTVDSDDRQPCMPTRLLFRRSDALTSRPLVAAINWSCTTRFKLTGSIR